MKLVDHQWVSRAPKLRRVAPFDGMRGIGVFGVMAGHSFGEHTKSFSAIVDLFFVLSGFLITTLLLQEHRSTGKVALKKFYARRSLRLLPLLYVVLGINAVAGVAVKVGGLVDNTQYSLSGLAEETLGAGVYIYNWLFPTLNGSWMAHMWTLSVEEQFYLVVGVTMLFVLQRGGIRAFAWGLGILTVIIQLSRAFFVLGPFGALAVGSWIQRPDSLMIGMLCALVSANLADPLSPRAEKYLGWLGWAGVVGLFVAVWTSTTWFASVTGIHIDYVPASEVINKALDGGVSRFNDGHVYWVQWGSSLGSWSAMAIALAAFRCPSWFPNKLTSWAPLAWIGGSLSYGLYVWHYLVNHYLRILFGTRENGLVLERLPVPFLVQLLLDVALPFLLAVPSYYLVERKALAIKDRFAVEKVDAASGGAAGGSGRSLTRRRARRTAS